MSLRIIKSTEPIEIKTLVMCIYTVPGIGKTSTGFTAEKPLLLDFDKGAHRSKHRRGDVVPIDAWEDVTGITADDLRPYKTLVADTAGRALDVLTAHIIRETPKFGRGGALTLQGFGELKAKFIAWLKFVRSFGLDVVLLCHCDEQRNGDDLIERLDVQGGSKGEIYKSADAMGRIYYKGDKRILSFSPTETSFGKNPAQLPPIEVPDFKDATDFLAGVIAQTKAGINALSAEQAAAVAAMAEWTTRIGEAAKLEDFNALIEPAKAALEAVRENVKRLIVKVAKEKGFVFDPKLGAFMSPEAKKSETPPSPPSAVTPPAAEPAREPGSDDGDDADRKAAEPTAAEIAKMGGPAPELPGVGGKAPAKKGKAA